MKKTSLSKLTLQEMRRVYKTRAVRKLLRALKKDTK